MRQVLVGAGVVVVELGEVAGDRLGEGLGAELGEAGQLDRVVLDLLLEERRQHDGRDACVLELAQGVDLPGERG